MEVPGKAVGNRPRPGIGLVARGSIALQSGRDVIGITNKGATRSEAAERARKSHART